MEQLTFQNRLEFRSWLTEHARSEDGVWLVFCKDGSIASIKAGEALEEALCFGWIDGRMESLDGSFYRKYFKQRRADSRWSARNNKLAEELEAGGRMTEWGREKIRSARQNGCWDAPPREQLTEEQLEQFSQMLQPFETARANFLKMSPSARKSYAGSWFFGARTDEGRQRRFQTIVERLNLNLNPMESMRKKQAADTAADAEEK